MNRVVLITGAASGLGWALSRAHLSAGDQVVLADRDATLLQQREHECSDSQQVMTCLCDVTDAQQLAEMLVKVDQRFGRLDVLVNNAGITHRSAAAETDPAVVRRVMATLS